MKGSSTNKKPVGFLKLQIVATKATPAPPIGPALGQKGLNIMEFCKQFNEKTKGMEGPMPTVISYYADKTFSFIFKKPPASYLIKKAAKGTRTNPAGEIFGSKQPGKETGGTIRMSDLRKIAEIKHVDMTSSNMEAAIKSLMGTAISIGLTIEDDESKN